MKKLVILLTSLAMVVGFSTVSFAVITGSSHDFSGQTWTTEICNVCHTPHNANTTSGTLWDHDVTTSAGFTLYDGGTGTPGSITGKSLLCLSCHDGTVALDSFGGTTGTNFISGVALLTKDLSNDHPIEVALPGTGYHTSGEITTAGLVLENSNEVMCASCHEPHNNGLSTTAMLRVDNAASALCLTCHIK